MSGHQFSWSCYCSRCVQHDPDPAPADARVTDFQDIWKLPLEAVVEPAPDADPLDVVHQEVYDVWVDVEVVQQRRVGSMTWERVETSRQRRIRSHIR